MIAVTLFLYLTRNRGDCVLEEEISPRIRELAGRIRSLVLHRHVRHRRAILKRICSHEPPLKNQKRGSTVDELARPFVLLWDWVDRTGGFPGKVFFLCVVVMMIIGGLTWYSNKR